MKTEPIATTTQCSEPGFLKLAVSKDILGKPAYETIASPEPNFQEIERLCSDRPIMFNGRPTDSEIEAFEDEVDIQNALDSLREPGSTNLDDFKKQLGL